MFDFPLGAPSKEGEVKLYHALVLSVNEETRTCNVRIDESKGYTLKNVPYCTPSIALDGSGIDYTPISGSHCLVVTETSNFSSPVDTIAYIIAFAPKVSDTGDRLPVAEGDVVISSPEGNRLEIHNNGVNKLMAHEECSIEMYADSSKIETYCASKVIKTAGGSVEWLSDGDNETNNTTFRAELKTKASRELNTNRLFLFEAGDAGTPEVVAKILDPYDTNSPGRIVWSGNSNGDITLETEGSLAENFAGSVTTNAEISMTLKSPTIKLQASNATIKVDSNKIFMDADDVTIRTDRIHVQSRSTDQVFLTSETETIVDTANKQLVTEDILDWLFNHIHPQAGMPPLGAPIFPNEHLPISEEAAVALLIAEQANAALFKLDDIVTMQSVELALDALSGTPAAPAAAPIRQILGILKTMVENQKAGYLQAVSGSTNGGSGVLYSYGQVLTQDTKVR